MNFRVFLCGFILLGCTENVGQPDMKADLAFAFASGCADGAKDGDESDVDCGGSCKPCGPNKSCAGGKDCEGGVCANRLCVGPSCGDAVKNGDETDVDCGGSCPHACAEGQHCSDGSDCQSAMCVNNICTPVLCMDGKQDGMETDIDCGGPLCLKCMDGKACSGNSDCLSGTCRNNICSSPCPAGTADCDGNPQNGCEAHLMTDNLNCGHCGQVCPKAMPTCAMAMCTASSPCTNGSSIDCNPANSTLLKNSAFIDPSPPMGWTQCFGFVNTVGDDVSVSALDNCLGAKQLRIRYFDPNRTLAADVYQTALLGANAWPATWKYLDGCNCVKLMLPVCGALWNCASDAGLTVSTNGTGGGNYMLWAPGGPALSNGNCYTPTISVADTDGKELSTLNCGHNDLWLNYAVAVYK